MKKINQSSKPKISNSSKTIFFILLIAIVVFIYEFTKKDSKKKQTNSFSALYSGKSKKNSPALPSKLKWADSFKGVNNMGNK